MKYLGGVLMLVGVWGLAVGLIAAEGEVGKIPITTASEDARHLYLQGMDLQDRFKFFDSRGLFEQAVKLDPNFALAYRGLAFSQTSAKDFQDCLALAADAAEHASECERLWIGADEAASQADFPKQREKLGQLIAKCPDDERAHNSFAVYYWGRQYYDSAAAELQRAVDINPSFIPAWNMLGYARRNLNDYPGAEQAFLKYIELNPTDANPYDSYAELLLKEGRFEEAITRYREALKVDSTFNASRFNLASPLVYLGRHEEARRELQELLARARNDGERQTAHFGMAMTYFDEGNYDAALKELQANGEIAAKNDDIAQLAGNAITIGMLQWQFEYNEDAIVSFKRAVEIVEGSKLAPTQIAATERAALYGEALIALQRDDLTKAKTLIDSYASLANAAGTVDVMRQLHELNGRLALAKKQYDKAAEELSQANLQRADLLYKLALAQKELGEHQKALANMTTAAQINSLLNMNDLSAWRKAKLLADDWGKR